MKAGSAVNFGKIVPIRILLDILAYSLVAFSIGVMLISAVNPLELYFFPHYIRVLQFMMTLIYHYCWKISTSSFLV
jgi:hypothetical protein